MGTNKQFTIYVAKSRFTDTLKENNPTWASFKQRFKNPTSIDLTPEHAATLDKQTILNLKDCGGYVAGRLKNGNRTKENILDRCMIVLDADAAPDNFPTILKEKLTGYHYLAHTTFNHRPNAPRWRLIIPLNNPIPPNQYPQAATEIINLFPTGTFDPTTNQAARLMFYPATLDGQPYQLEEGTGKYYQPTPQTQTNPTSPPHGFCAREKVAGQADPLSKGGFIGAFCRAYYPITKLLDSVLADKYVRDDSGRYTYRAGSSAAGVVVYEDKFVYSNHATDPAGGRRCNAYDLARLHLFGDVSEREGHFLMQEFCTKDPKVMEEHKKHAAGAMRAFKKRARSMANSCEKDKDWVSSLSRNRLGNILPDVDNLVAILTHDEALAGLGWDERLKAISMRPSLPFPWKREKGVWGRLDLSNLKHYLKTHYKIRKYQMLPDAVNVAASMRAFNPISDYLDSLQGWDGIERAEYILHDFLGADDSGYVRAVTRLMLSAAVKRVREPGIKFDTMLVMVGKQGKGKSTLFHALAGEWFSDSLTLAVVGDIKKATESVIGSWIAEISEMDGLTKSGVETVKSFMSRQSDQFRPSYDTAPRNFDRSNIFIGSTNKMNGFLIDTTGNRRFLIVPTLGKSARKPWELTSYERDQIWAEVLSWGDQPLFLTEEMDAAAEQVQNSFMATDEKIGLIDNYLQTLVPPDFARWSRPARLDYYDKLEKGDFPLEGAVKREAVTIMEIWAECYLKAPETITKKDSNAISASLIKLGWQSDKSIRLRAYGVQKSWVKTTTQP